VALEFSPGRLAEALPPHQADWAARFLRRLLAQPSSPEGPLGGAALRTGGRRGRRAAEARRAAAAAALYPRDVDFE
jgi:hypothetical protein